ncbi:MAG: hypothetical protein PHN69_02660 [Candidatus Pacebacteria bacterium]|nr:hypothetical protein [Candidatus Paceibacterota bacterium]
MNEFKLNYLHICDIAFLSENKKANIIGIFKVIYSSTFPMAYPKFSVIISLDTNPIITKGNHKLQLKLIRMSDGKENNQIVNVDFEVSTDQNEINFIVDIVNSIFEKQDKYNLITYVDNKEINRTAFEVVKTN